MVFVSRKVIKGKARYYLEKSVRLPNGTVKKFSVYLKGYEPKIGLKGRDSYIALLNAKVRAAVINHAAEFYVKSGIFGISVIKKLEEVRLAYNELRKKISKKQLQDIIDRFTVNFTYETNAIEGNSLTLKDVAIVLHEKKAIEGKDLREIYEALNTREAMQLIFDNKLKITEQDIIKLHRILVQNTGVAFGYKKLPNFLLGRDIKTTPPEKVEEEMREMIKWYNDNEKIHPLERASVFHGRFEAIHPFEDGNGRVGRLLINVILMNNGYPPLIIRKTHRTSYLACLEAFDNSHSDKLKRFLIEKYKATYKKFFEVYIRYLK